MCNIAHICKQSRVPGIGKVTHFITVDVVNNIITAKGTVPVPTYNYGMVPQAL